MGKLYRGYYIVYLLFFCAGLLLIIPKFQSNFIQRPSQVTKLAHLRVFLFNTYTLAVNKEKIQAKDPTLMPAYTNLIKQADELLFIKPVSVMDKSQIPPSGDKHDYMSLATYAWPNTKISNGLPYVVLDGKLILK